MSSSCFPATPGGTPRLSPLGQHDGGLLHKSPGRALSKTLLHPGEKHPRMGSMPLAFTESNACVGCTEQRSRHVVKEQPPLGRVDAPSPDSLEDMGHYHCPTYFSKNRHALAHDWPSLLLYAFPPIALIHQVIKRAREGNHRILLVAPLWRSQHWFSDMAQLLSAAPWPIPLRRNLLSQANRTIWHPQPELWALHVWPLNGTRQTRERPEHHFAG